MTQKYVITNNYRVHMARQFVESLTESANTSYYLFAAKHLPFANSSIPQPYDTVKTVTVDVYNDMMYGKRVSNNDVSLMIRRVDWASNTQYAIYDDIDTSLFDKDFYAVVNAGAYYHVWKCLDNNNDGYSTVQPNFADIDAQDEVYETSDKYRWKYMYSVSSTNVDKFGTDEYFPVGSNSSVQASAIDGAIDYISVDEEGLGYDNYLTGTFANNDIKLNGNVLVYAISSNASSVNSYYNDCTIYIASGTGAGQYRRITNYIVNATTKSITLNSAFSTIPTNSSEYEIYPTVEITGDGTESSIAVGRALINAVGNTVNKIEMLERGAGYTYAVANVLTSNVVGVTTNASVRVIYSPDGGHGSDPAKELFSSYLCISVKFANNESNTIPVTNDIYQIGLLKDPLFTNVVIGLTSVNGTFVGNEKVFKIDPKLIKANATLSITSANVNASDADFENQFDVGDYVYFSGNNQHQLSVINTITNSSQIILNSNSLISDTANTYYPNMTTTGYVTAYTVGNVSLSNVSGLYSVNDKIIGEDSGAYAVINTITRSGKSKGFDTFIQMYTYRVQISSGGYAENEVVYQSDLSLTNAYVHSVESLGSGFYRVSVTNQLGIFNVGESLDGANSGTTGTILEKYSPELVFNSGEVLYLENIEAVTRQNNQTETFKLIFEF